jgi:hypothetical protein
MKTFGIIFYEFINNKMNIYLKKNTKEYYEDILYLYDEYINNELININNIISPIFKYKINEHTILLLNINKYKQLYNLITLNNNNINIQKINFIWFCNKNVHKNLKHKRIKDFELINNLQLIDLNYKIKL